MYDRSYSSIPKTLAGFQPQFSYNNISGFTAIDTKAAAFETQNGESIALYYNPNCAPDMGETSKFIVLNKMCANFMYDLNGNKGPNQVNKDIGFITAFYSVDPVVVAPIFAGYNSSAKTDETRLPNLHEAMSLLINEPYIGSGVADIFATSTPVSGKFGKFWSVFDSAGWEMEPVEGYRGENWYVKR